jgi:hypothetical protein
MPCNLGFKGESVPFLNNDKIDEQVEKNKLGVYGLDRGSEKDPFKVYYVGRADSCLNTRLKKHVGEKYGNSTYKWFKYEYANSVKEAYEKECQCYHHFGGKDKLDNDVHPKKPENTNLKCPVCGE